MTEKHSFYRPHARVTENNEIIDPETGEISHPPSMTKQSFAEQCDINNILKQYKTSGIVTHINAQAQMGMYTDLPDDIDYQEGLEMIIRAERAFDSLPSKVRSRFENDPQQFLAFCGDRANRDEMLALGLIKPPPPEPSPEPPQASPEAKTGVQG